LPGGIGRVSVTFDFDSMCSVRFPRRPDSRSTVSISSRPRSAPNGIDPRPGGAWDLRMARQVRDDYARWLAKGDVAHLPKPIAGTGGGPLNVAASRTVTPGMDPAKADTIRPRHALRYLGSAQSISNIGQ